MSKFIEADNDTIKMVDEIAGELNLQVYGIDFQPLFVPKAKTPVQVKRATDVTEYLSKRNDLILLIIDERCWDAVEEKVRYMWLRMAMEQVGYDTEKDKLFIGVPMLNIPLSFYEKYTAAAINAAKLQILTMDKILQDEKEKKAAEKANKKGKRGNNS